MASQIQTLEVKLHRLQRQLQAVQEQDIVIRDNIITNQGKQINLLKRNNELRRALEVCEYCKQTGHSLIQCLEFARDTQ